MKRLHRADLYAWSVFNEERNIDPSVLWTRPEGNVLIDPLPVSAHDHKHLEERGAAWIVLPTRIIFGMLQSLLNSPVPGARATG